MALSVPLVSMLHCVHIVVPAIVLAAVAISPSHTTSDPHPPGSSGSADLLLHPLSPTSGREVALVLFPAPQLLPAQYLPLAKAMQEEASSQHLWVTIVSLDNVTEPPKRADIALVMDRVTQEMVAQGFKRYDPTFIAVHSQAMASVVQDYVASNVNTSGLILLGSYLKRSYRGTSPSYPIPTLTIGGELDGVCRVTRIMEEYVHRHIYTKNQTDAITRFPVAVVRGMTHLQFASGKPSATILEYDLKPEVADTKAQRLVSLVAACFMDTILGNSSSLVALKEIDQDTFQFMSPLISAYSKEGSYQLKPPCNENPPGPSCQVGCPWTSSIMSLMADVKNVTINDMDSFHPASEIFPAIHHPKILSDCSLPGPNCTVSMSSVSQNIYYEDKTDSGLVPNAACEIRAKLKSRQSVMLAAGYRNVEFNISDAGSRCKTINQHAYDWALNQSDSTTRERFHKYGIPILVGEDQGCFHNGGLWIYLPMKYKLTGSNPDAVVLEVSSIQLKTDVKYPIGMFQGMHFCKLLSPAKIMEWIYVDGLRAHYSLSGNLPKIMNCGL
jgi:hypothetical protein